MRGPRGGRTVSRRSERLALPVASPGTRRHLVVHRFGAPGGRPRAYLHAALHAQELPGIVALDHLARLLDEAEAEGRVTGEIILVPFANPAGLSQQIMAEALGRHDLDTRRNYNRGFPDIADEVAVALEGRLGDDADANLTAARRAVAACLARREALREDDALKLVLFRLSCDADLVLDLHSAWEALPHLFVTDVDWPDMADLGRQFGAEVVIVDRGNRMMTFKSAHALLWKSLAARFPAHPLPPGCRTAVVELRGQRDVDDRFSLPDARNLFRWLQRRGVVAGNAGPLPAPLCEPCPVARLRRVFAPEGGVVTYAGTLGDRVEAGRDFARILDPASATAIPVAAPVTGRLYARRGHRLVRKGQYFCAIAGEAAQR